MKKVIKKDVFDTKIEKYLTKHLSIRIENVGELEVVALKLNGKTISYDVI